MSVHLVNVRGIRPGDSIVGDSEFEIGGIEHRVIDSKRVVREGYGLRISFRVLDPNDSIGTVEYSADEIVAVTHDDPIDEYECDGDDCLRLVDVYRFSESDLRDPEVLVLCDYHAEIDAAERWADTVR